ncbi:MAG: basic secretory protein-like protein [Elusimicrobiales bacterium]
MDIIYRLRIIFWFLIILIWAIYLYQYISEDLEKERKTKIILSGDKRSLPIQKKTQPPSLKIHNEFYTFEEKLEKQELQKKEDFQPRIAIAKTDDISLPQSHLKEEFIKEVKKEKKSEIPKGFIFKKTRHFNLYIEEGIEPDEIEKEVEALHGEMMLELIAFSPWSRDERVDIYLALNPLKYQELSGRPGWSGGAANLKERKIYLYKSHEWTGILAHELTHIYFDSFFGGYDKSPLWLSEGMAVYIQIQYGGSKPMWIQENLKRLVNGNYYRIKDLIETRSLDDMNEKNVKLWYTQVYTVVYLLLKIQQKDEFYQFCRLIKEGNSTSKSLYLAYGKPYITLNALESVWKFEVKKIYGSI